MLHAKWCAFAIVVCVSSASAESYRDRLQADLNQALAKLNTSCGTSITLVAPDWAAWEKANAKAQDCAPIMDAIRAACLNDQGTAHPAGQAFVKAKVTAVKCGLLPDNNKSEEKVTIEKGIVVFTRVPGYSPTGDAPRLLHASPAFQGIADAKREWDLENVDAPKAAEGLKKRCGDDAKLTIDIASWKAAGDSGNNIPKALDIGEMCSIYASGMSDVCRDHKDAVRKKLDGLRCTYKKAQKGKASVAIKGREVVVTSSSTIAPGDGKLVREAVEKHVGKKAK